MVEQKTACRQLEKRTEYTLEWFGGDEKTSEGKFAQIVGGHQEWKTGMDEQELIEHCYEPFVKLCEGLEMFREELDQTIREIEYNADEDTLFERMVLARLKELRKKWLGSEEKK